jgi:hypothetical protein
MVEHVSEPGLETEARAEWQLPCVKRLVAGSAESGNSNNTDGDDTAS